MISKIRNQLSWQTVDLIKNHEFLKMLKLARDSFNWDEWMNEWINK